MTLALSDPFFNDYFSQMIDTLETLRSPADDQCELMGSYNSGWELQHDVVDMIEAVVASPSNNLSGMQNDLLREIQNVAKILPKDAINSPGCDMKTRNGCIKSLQHPAWIPLRGHADKVLEFLQIEIALNRARLAFE